MNVHELALMAAVERGVHEENGVYRFSDPGTPLTILRELPVCRQKSLMYKQRWYDEYDWAQREDEPRERTIKPLVQGSLLQHFTEQQKLLLPDEELIAARCLATFLVINALSTGKRLLPRYYARCIERDKYNNPIVVGCFGFEGVMLNDTEAWGPHSIYGMAAIRKF